MQPGQSKRAVGQPPPYHPPSGRAGFYGGIFRMIEAKRPYGQGDNSYQSAGGYDGIKQLVDDFYAAMDTLPEAAHIRAMHPDDLATAADKLTRFLCGWLGGPRLFSEKYGPNRKSTRLNSSHVKISY